jgi:hypothetical protein
MQSATYETDGISYEINVYEEGEGFVARWTCLACNRDGGVPYASPTTAEAIGRAETHLLNEHHVQAHRAT